MKPKYFIDADKLLLKSFRKGLSSDTDILRKAIKIRLLKELLKGEDASYQ